VCLLCFYHFSALLEGVLGDFLLNSQCNIAEDKHPRSNLGSYMTWCHQLKMTINSQLSVHTRSYNVLVFHDRFKAFQPHSASHKVSETINLPLAHMNNKFSPSSLFKRTNYSIRFSWITIITGQKVQKVNWMFQHRIPLSVTSAKSNIAQYKIIM